MGKLCIIGVDDHKILKDFIRAHVELLDGEKVCLDHWYPDHTYQGRTIRYFYSRHPLRTKLRKLLPQVLYHRWVTQKERSPEAVADAYEAFFLAHDVDVILAEFGSSGVGVCPHAHKLGIPLIVHFHGHDAHRSSFLETYAEPFKDMFAHAFRIISVSNYQTEALVNLGAPREKVICNPYGPRERYFQNEPDYSPTFLALGRFTDIKANHLTLMAFRKVLESCPEARLVMAGDGELLECCKSLAHVWGISESISFPGAVPHDRNLSLFSQACCFVQHSVVPSYGDAEGTPVVILEAQAAGLPVVSTRHAGITDAVVHEKTGFLVDERDIDGMAEHMLRLVEARELCRTMGAAARKHILDNYSLERHIRCLQDVINAARRQS